MIFLPNITASTSTVRIIYLCKKIPNTAPASTPMNTLHGSLVEKRLVDRAYFFIAPKIVGGTTAKSPVMGEGILNLSQALTLDEMEIKKLAGDILITGRIK